MKDSLSPQQEKLEQLKQLLPEAFTEGKVDWEKLKLSLGDDINIVNERYVLNWAGKSNAYKVLQEPTSKTLIPEKEESVDFDKTENLFIEGDNLEALKILQKSYFGKVKMIYIDPPYNTGKDSFIYPDRFKENLEDYQKNVGDKDDEGYLIQDSIFKKNRKENGHFHSNWLNMMMPRLYLAKNLLRDDGVIFISIDDNEVQNLKLLMNEIFGEENFIAQMIILTGSNQSNANVKIQTNSEYCLVYSRNMVNVNINHIDEVDSSLRNLNDAPTPLETRLDMGYTVYYNPQDKHLLPIHDYDKSLVHLNKEAEVYNDRLDLLQKGYVKIRPGKRSNKLHRWRWAANTFKDRINEVVVVEVEKKSKKIYSLKFKQFGFNAPKNILNFTSGTKELKVFFNNQEMFDSPKNTSLLKRLLAISTLKNSVVLDFFAGSGTTSHAVMQLNAEDGGHRKCISIQLPELCDEKKEAFKAGYKTIADIAKERIKRAGQKIKEENKDKENIEQLDIGFKVLKVAESNFKEWQTDVSSENLSQQLNLHVDPIAEDASIENMVYELMLKNGKDLNCHIKHHNHIYSISDQENHNENVLILLLEEVNEGMIENVLQEKPNKVIALDKLFKNNDQLKTNTALQMQDADIKFETI